MPALERRIGRLEKLETEMLTMEAEVRLPELERALMSLDICIHPERRSPERGEYFARLEDWFRADRNRLMPFAKAMSLICAAGQAEADIRHRVAIAFGLEDGVA